MAAVGETPRIVAADAAQVDGRLRAGVGGATHQLPGARLASSGLPVARWNLADVDDPALVDPRAVAGWYAGAGGGVPWRTRVPAGRPWPQGRRVLTARCLVLEPAAFRGVEPRPGVRLREARRGDEEAVASVLADQLDLPDELCRRWLAPQLASSRHHVVLLEHDGRVAALGVGVRTFDRAGPCTALAATSFHDDAREAGLDAVLLSDLVARALAGGARLAVRVTEDAGEDVAPLLRLGFAETGGLDVYENA